jgi:hypothetical protein
VIQGLTGPGTEMMPDLRSTVGIDEKSAAVPSVHRLVRLEIVDAGDDVAA